MFTYKKIAMVAAAGLAAFAMSCSDDGDDKKVGTITGIDAKARAGSALYDIEGVVAAEASDGDITAITVKAATGEGTVSNDAAKTIASLKGDAANLATVELKDMGWYLAPKKCGTGETTYDVNLTVTATIDGEEVSESKTVEGVKCDAEGITVPSEYEFDKVQELTFATAAGSLGSFVDFDGTDMQVLKEAPATSAKNDVDLVFWGAKAATPKACAQDAANCYNGGKTAMTGSTAEVAILEVGSATVATAEEVMDFYANAADDDFKTVVTTEANKSYIVETSAGNVVLIKIDGAFTATAATITMNASRVIVD